VFSQGYAVVMLDQLAMNPGGFEALYEQSGMP
jgi:hypothetical protein